MAGTVHRWGCAPIAAAFGLGPCLLAAGVPFADSVPAPDAVEIRVNARNVLEPVNRRVFGVCAIFQPFDDAFRKIWAGCFDGASVRIWANTRFFAGGPEDLAVCESAWVNVLQFVRSGRFAERFAFCPFTNIGRKARYVSEKDNNLDGRHQPSALAAYIRWLNKAAHPGFPKGFGVTGWEVWNEPQFPANGAWAADDYARYVLDCAEAVRRVDPGIEIGASLHEGDHAWNRRMLGVIAAVDPAAIDFAVSHPYDFYWIRSRRIMGDYYARVSGAEVLRTEKIRPHVQDLFAIGHGRWRLVCSEWNTHPPGYEKPYHVSTDIAVALHVAAMFGVFWEEHVDSAQFFQLYGRGAEGHFSLVRRTGNGPVLNPTGEVFRLYSRWFRGQRLAVGVKTPDWGYPGRPGVRVPAVFSQAAVDAKSARLVVMIGNRHRDRNADVLLAVTQFVPRAFTADWYCVTVDAPDSCTARVVRRSIAVSPGPDPRVSLRLPPHSVSALVFTGVTPPSECELFSQRLRFVREWAVGRVLDPVEAPDHGLAASLPADVTTPRQKVTADSTGFVNLALLLEASGKAAALREGFQAVATTWVFSPVERTVGVSLGLDYWGIVEVGGASVLEVKHPEGPPQADRYRGRMHLRPGWNLLKVRVASGSKGFGFRLALEETGDLLTDAGFARPPWPRTWRVCAGRGADVNSWKGRRNRANPDRDVLEVSPQKPNLRRAYVAWPPLALPPGADLQHVKAEIRLQRAYSKGEGRVWVRPVLEGWDPDTLTFERQPRLGAPLPQRVPVENEIWTFAGGDVDRLVRSWIERPQAVFGIAVESDVKGYAAFWSDDAPRKAPRLLLSVGTNAGKKRPE